MTTSSSWRTLAPGRAADFSYRDTFRLELPLRGLFEAPTVAGLAEQIGSARAGQARIRDLPIVAEPIQEEYPLSFSQERFWFLSQLDPNNLAYKVTHGFRLSGPLNIDALEKTLSEIMRRHETLRTTFHLSDDKPVLRISKPPVVYSTINYRSDAEPPCRISIRKSRDYLKTSTGDLLIYPPTYC